MWSIMPCGVFGGAMARHEAGRKWRKCSGRKAGKPANQGGKPTPPYVGLYACLACICLYMGGRAIQPSNHTNLLSYILLLFFVFYLPSMVAMVGYTPIYNRKTSIRESYP